MKQYDKLVRDNIVDHIMNNGGKARYYIVKGKDKFVKAVEILNEKKLALINAINVNDKNKIIEKIADIGEVKELLINEFHGLATEETTKQLAKTLNLVDRTVLKLQLDKNEIQTIQKNKLEKKGGFKKGIVLESASDQ